MYVTILHTKSSYLIGNVSYTISFFQKEYPLNFYYPSIYYLVKYYKLFILINYNLVWKIRF